MAIPTRIRTRVSAGQLQALYRSFSWLIGHWDIDNHHDYLLYHHAAEFRQMYKDMLDRKQQPRYTLKFTELQAIAFAQLWDTNYKYLQEYDEHTIYTVNSVIDKERKRLKPLIEDDT